MGRKRKRKGQKNQAVPSEDKISSSVMSAEKELDAEKRGQRSN